jgi:hypothetical protein
MNESIIVFCISELLFFSDITNDVCFFIFNLFYVLYKKKLFAGQWLTFSYVIKIFNHLLELIPLFFYSILH